ncbi:MAG: ATP-binding cassette domain-containing protein [Candidatus Bathyarchaeia archaeon]
MTQSSEILLEVVDLVKYFPVQRRSLKQSLLFWKEPSLVHAVDGVSFNLKKNQTIGIVGESGCGKSTLGRTILLLTKPTSGKIFFEGINMVKLKKAERNKILGRMQIVFQDPFSSLDPRMRAKNIVAEPLRAIGIKEKAEINKRTVEIFEKVGLNPEHLNRFPHEFSGGQRQRISIARALVSDPSLVVLDEPTSSLDVSIQGQILNLLKDLQYKCGLSYIFISHNVSAVYQMSDEIAVMYVGKFVELADSTTIVRKPLHPYTVALISAIPRFDPNMRIQTAKIKGEIPSPINPPSGCRYHPRCPYADKKCSTEMPLLTEVKNGHFVACHHL